ncbi:5'-AMP-activated protein kinase subunit beta-1a isoform X2 [Hippoglossus hippoglossus]|uniref:5'-AMP-activated protein kinase subunit beta-1a isoform X2 n=1 Tax=Hippoglossus hippoglossus TaxID=8267 RepID=UPI00148E14B2|nr:5'-AMP-activated protein kinase subunit beta-1a isoform X2 [Hippoglossus hippoglossus]
MGNTSSERAALGQGEKAQRRDSRGTKEGDRPKILMDSPEDADIFHAEDMKPVVTSQLGTVNNIIQVKKTDFEVFDALMVDSQKCSDMSDLSSSPPGPYHQDAYVPKQEEKFKSPPILPPHLLQVILNKDTGISCDPALLPEPNHVMLNHLYALSIKDGVMVLSGTHRYKKKYVTTLLYKPI